MENEVVDTKKLKQGQLMAAAKAYLKNRKLKEAFDKIADRLEFVEEIDNLKKDLDEVEDYMTSEIKAIEKGEITQEKLDTDVVKIIKGYAVADWAKLVRKWKSQD